MSSTVPPASSISDLMLRKMTSACPSMSGGSSRVAGSVPVMIDDKLVGVVSERDYARKVILRDKSSKQTRVSEIMTQSVVTVTSHDRVADCVDLMLKHHIRHLVVVDEGTVAGMLSLRDLYTEIIDEQAETIDQLEHYVRGEQ